MRKSIIIIMFFAILLSLLPGCSGNGADTSIPKITKPEMDLEGEYDGILKLVYPVDIMYSFLPDSNRIDVWENYIYDKYNRNIDLQYVQWKEDSSDNEFSGIDIDKLKTTSESEGLVYLYDIIDLKTLADTDLLLPLNDYLDDISGKGKIDGNLYESLQDSDKNLWGIPLQETSVGVSRYYNKDWLDKANVSVPTTIDDFISYAQYVKNNDPDGDGQNNTYIASYSLQNIESDLKDIFAAFGCYTNGNNGTIAYNPIVGEYQIMGLTDNFIDAVSFIKGLVKEGYIIDKNKISSEADYYKIIASDKILLSRLSNKIENSYGFYIMGDNKKSLIMIQPSYIIGVLNSTKEPAEQLSSFIHMFYENPDCTYDFIFGIKGEDYSDEGEYYLYKQFSNGLRNTIIGIQTALNRTATAGKPLVIEEGSQYMNMQNNIVLETETLDTELFYSIPFDKQEPQIPALNSLIAKETFELYEDIFFKNYSIEIALQDYKRKLKNLGVIEILEKLNNQ